MENIQGFIAINAYALILMLFIMVVFYSKRRLHHTEDNAYSYLLVATIMTTFFGIILGLLVVPKFNIDRILISITNKIYLISLTLWTLVLTFYTFYISRIKEGRPNKQIKIFMCIGIIISLLTLLLPISTNIDGNIAVATGLSVYFTYSIVTILFLIMFMLLILDHRNLKNKKYIPIYSLAILGSLVLVVQIFTNLNYLINPALVLIVTFMYFTIENPDVDIINQLTLSRDQAEKANRAKSDFLSSMSHEIRTPLNAIVGFSEDIQSRKENVAPEIVEDADYIMEASKTLLEIVGNILDINKIESNKMELVEEKYNFREEVETLAKINATRIGDKQIDFKLDIALDLPYELIGDRTHIKQILNNLLSNAFKYTDKGEVSLSVKCINQNDICNLIISVKDTGKGIKSDDINKLFTKFERLDVEKNSTTEGTGLGLAITKALVDMMGGKINVSSQFGQGSIFMVQIPQKISKIVNPNLNIQNNTQIISTNENATNQAKKENTEIENQSSKIMNSGSVDAKKVLIVDDNKLNIKVARRALDGFNFEIDECYDGQECLDKIINGDEYDLILMDIMMPNMSGETAIEKLKEKPDFKIPIIALTADAVVGAREKYISEGFIDYIAKPFNKEQIKEKLDIVFGSSNSTQENKTEEDEVVKAFSDMSKPLSETEVPNQINTPVYNPEIDRFKDVPAYIIVDNGKTNDDNNSN